MKKILITGLIFLASIGVMLADSDMGGNIDTPPSVSFDKDPVKVGIGANRHSEIPDYPAVTPPSYSHRLKATISPKDKAGEVTFDSSKSTRATVAEVSRTNVDDTVEVILKVTGVTETPSTASTGDTDIQAKWQGNIIAKTKVVVLKPKTRTNVVPGAPTERYNTVTRNPDAYVSIVNYDVTITVFDQFGAVLDSIYNGNGVVTENMSWNDPTMNRGWVDIEFPDKEFINGIKMDRAGLAPNIPVTGLDWISDDNEADWKTWKRKVAGYNNAFGGSGYDNTVLVLAIQQLRVDGHDVSPNYSRQYKFDAVDFPALPLVVEDKPQP